MPIASSGDCYTHNSPWPWFFGGANLGGATNVTAMDYTSINGGNFLVGGHTTDPLVCTDSQVYLALISQTTGSTVWVRSLNTEILRILAIKWMPAPLTRAVVVALHPNSMFLIQVNIDGTVTPSWMINGWSYLGGTYRDIVANEGLVFDNTGKLYLGVKSEFDPAHTYSWYKFDMNASNINTFKVWNLDMASNKPGGINAVAINANQSAILTGGWQDGKATIQVSGVSPTRYWWLIQPSTTVFSQVILLHPFVVDTQPHVAAAIKESASANGPENHVIMSMAVTSPYGPFSPSFLRITSGPYKLITMKGISATTTIVFGQNLTTRNVELITIDWTTNVATFKSFNYGLDPTFAVMTALLFPQANGQTDIYFAG